MIHPSWVQVLVFLKPCLICVPREARRYIPIRATASTESDVLMFGQKASTLIEQVSLLRHINIIIFPAALNWYAHSVTWVFINLTCVTFPIFLGLHFPPNFSKPVKDYFKISRFFFFFFLFESKSVPFLPLNTKRLQQDLQQSHTGVKNTYSLWSHWRETVLCVTTTEKCVIYLVKKYKAKRNWCFCPSPLKFLFNIFRKPLFAFLMFLGFCCYMHINCYGTNHWKPA